MKQTEHDEIKLELEVMLLHGMMRKSSSISENIIWISRQQHLYLLTVLYS